MSCQEEVEFQPIATITNQPRVVAYSGGTTCNSGIEVKNEIINECSNRDRLLFFPPCTSYATDPYESALSIDPSSSARASSAYASPPPRSSGLALAFSLGKAHAQATATR